MKSPISLCKNKTFNDNKKEIYTKIYFDMHFIGIWPCLHKPKQWWKVTFVTFTFYSVNSLSKNTLFTAFTVYVATLFFLTEKLCTHQINNIHMQKIKANSWLLVTSLSSLLKATFRECIYNYPCKHTDFCYRALLWSKCK